MSSLNKMEKNKNEIKEYLKKELGLKETDDVELIKRLEKEPELMKRADKLLEEFLKAIR